MSDTQKDTLVVSLLRGRVGAAFLSVLVLILGYFGYSLGVEQQSAIIDLLIMVFSAGSTFYALWSKVRESKKKS